MTDLGRIRGAAWAAVATCAVGATVGSGARILVAVALVAMVVAGGVTFAHRSIRHARVTRSLRCHSRARELLGVALRTAELDGSAFVAGLGRPEIYCDERLPGVLDEDELRAVLLHERAHQRHRDPLRMTAVAVIEPVLGRFHGGRAWLARTAARREIAADRYAMEQGASRGAIASALLKVTPAGIHTAPAFAGSLELRVAALAGGPRPAPSRSWPWIVLGVIVGAVACAGVLMSHTFVPPLFEFLAATS